MECSAKISLKRVSQKVRHDTQHNDTQRNDINHNGRVMLCGVIYADCQTPECHKLALYFQWHYAERHYGE